MIKVINMHTNKLEKGDIRVDRGTPWGNQFKVGSPEAPTNAAACRLYEQWIADRPHLVSALSSHVEAVLESGETPRLACWCTPMPCHAHVLAELLASRA